MSNPDGGPMATAGNVSVATSASADWRANASAGEDQATPGAGRRTHRRKRRRKRRGSANSATHTGQNHAKPVSQRFSRPSTGTVSSKTYAALDLGTNNCRLLVARPSKPGQFRVVDAFSRIVRLGEGLTHHGKLSENAMDRAVEALGACRDKMRHWDLNAVRMIATEACRAASNGEVFLSRIEQETGLKLEIIDRYTEARLAVSGCANLLERRAKAAVLFDIGGGSSEIVLIDLTRSRHNHGYRLMSWTSLPMGVVSLSEMFGGQEVTPQIYEDMLAHVRAALDKFEGIDQLQNLSADEFHLLGTSGTVTTLAGLHLNLKRYNRRQVDGLWMERPQADKVIAKLRSMSFDERVASPCIGLERADLVLAGCAIFEAIYQRWPANRLRVADRGLREGILTQLMSADGVWRRRRRKRQR